MELIGTGVCVDGAAVAEMRRREVCLRDAESRRVQLQFGEGPAAGDEGGEDGEEDSVGGLHVGREMSDVGETRRRERECLLVVSELEHPAATPRAPTKRVWAHSA